MTGGARRRSSVLVALDPAIEQPVRLGGEVCDGGLQNEPEHRNGRGLCLRCRVSPHHVDVGGVGRDVWIVGGGDVAGQFAVHGLLDEVTVCWAPVTLGGGAQLLPRRLDLCLTDTARNGDFVCATYDVLHHR